MNIQNVAIDIQPIPVSVKNIRKQFVEVEALKNVSIDIPPGTFFTFLGPSGCGKTTLLRIISGFEKETSGDIYIGNTRVNDIPPSNRDIGFVFQNYALWPHMTVFDNVAYGLKLRKFDNKTIAFKVEEALERVGLANLGTRYPGKLSGGQQQRVAIARGLVLEPQVLLLDEPLSNLDAKLRIEMRTELRRLQKDIGITTLYVTHDQEEALEISDYIAVMSNGKVEQYGTPLEIYEHPATRFVASFIGEVTIMDGMVDDKGTFVLPGGTQLPLRLNEELFNKKCSIAVRPEDVNLVPLNTASAFPGKVLHSSYLGKTRLSVFEIDSTATLKVEHREVLESDMGRYGLEIKKFNVFE